MPPATVLDNRGGNGLSLSLCRRRARSERAAAGRNGLPAGPRGPRNVVAWGKKNNKIIHRRPGRRRETRNSPSATTLPTPSYPSLSDPLITSAAVIPQIKAARGQRFHGRSFTQLTVPRGFVAVVVSQTFHRDAVTTVFRHRRRAIPTRRRHRLLEGSARARAGVRTTMDAENDELLFCRFCLRHSQSSFPIFMASDPDLAKDVMSCLQIKITQDCVGPKHICNECYDRVQDWVMFKKQSEEALKEIESGANVIEKDVCAESVTTVSQMDLIDEVDYHCCIFCDKYFPSDYELLMHVSEIHQEIVDFDSKPKNRDETMEYIQSVFVDDEDSFQCDEYLEAINNKSSLKTNYEEFNEMSEMPTSDDGEEKFQCYYCSATFDEFVLLKEHSVSRHRDLNKKTECNKCNKIFLTVSDLKEHVRMTHPAKKDKHEIMENSMYRTPKRSPYVCHLCNKTFSRFCDLLDHDEIQHDDLPKRYRCGVCSKMFLMEDRAKVHYNFYHTKTKGTMNFQCSYCGMELKSASAVANHERMHITQKSQFGYKIIRD